MNADSKILLTEAEAAELLSMSSHFLRRDRIAANSVGIPFIRVGGSIRYVRADLEAWINEQKNQPRQRYTSPVRLNEGSTPRRRGRPTKAEQIARRSSDV